MKAQKVYGTPTTIYANAVYTVPEVADLLRIGKPTIYNKLSRKEPLPKHFKVGNRVRFMGKDILEFIEGNMVDINA